MIHALVEQFEKNRHVIESEFKKAHPMSYKDIVKLVIDNVVCESEQPDPEKIHEIDDGNYQGTLLYLVPENTYQPNVYYYVFVGYGSCSGCDTLEGIRQYGDGKPSDEQVKDYMTLALDVVRGIKKIGEWCEE